MGLGGMNAVSLSIARERASQNRLLLSESKYPIAERNAARTSDALRKSRLKTFDQCANAYISVHRASWKNAAYRAVGIHAGQLRVSSVRRAAGFRCRYRPIGQSATAHLERQDRHGGASAWRYQLKPLNDVISIWPIEGGVANQYALHKAKLTMASLGKNKHCGCADVQHRHFNTTAAECFLLHGAEDIGERVLAQKITDAIKAIASRMPAELLQRVAEMTFAGIVRNAKLSGDMSKN